MIVAAGVKPSATSVPDGLMSSTDASSKVAHLTPASAAPSSAAAVPAAAQPEPQGEFPSALAPVSFDGCGAIASRAAGAQQLLCSTLECTFTSRPSDSAVHMPECASSPACSPSACVACTTS